MKTTMRSIVFFGAGVAALLMDNANATVPMQERENVQMIVRLVEFSTFVTAVAIAVFVWRVSKRDSKNKKSKRDDS